jgi:hypothetical protein
MGIQLGTQPPPMGKAEPWKPPWQWCVENEEKDCAAREEAHGPLSPPFDGSQPHDSLIVFWTRRGQRWLDVLTPWSQFGHRCTLRLSGPDDNPSWMYTMPGRRRARYYAEDYYVLLTTAFVTLWACLTTGLTQASDWQEPTTAWILLIPALLLISLYAWASRAWVVVALVSVLWLAAGAVLLAVTFGPGGWIRWFVPWPLILRAIEILLMLVRITSFDTLQRGYMHTPVSRVKYLYYTILYIVQVCFIYTAIYAFWVPGGFYDPSSHAPVTGLNNHIYLSVMTITTLGSGFQPSSGLAQWLQMSEVAVGILILAVGLATFVGSLQLISLGQQGDSDSRPS